MANFSSTALAMYELGLDSGSLRAGRLLIVDDLAGNRDALTRRFRRRGFEIVEADSGPEALRLVDEQTFDCVLLDVMMPGMDGTEVLQRIRQKFSPSLLPVVMVTAKSQPEDIADALKFGANDYVTKPVDFVVALARVNSQIGRRRAELELLDSNQTLLNAKATLEDRVSERAAKLRSGQRNDPGRNLPTYRLGRQDRLPRPSRYAHWSRQPLYI